eukprot:gene3605-biopygen69
MPRRWRQNFDRRRARERQRQYNQNRRNNNRPPNAEEQQVADAVNELAAMELQIAQNELPDQQGNDENNLDQQPPQQFQPNQPAEQLNADQHPQLFFNLPQPHYLGMMENSCHHGHEKLLISEQNAHNVFTKCCFQEDESDSSVSYGES